MTSGEDTAGDDDLLVPGGIDWGREGGRDGGVSTRGKDAIQFASESPFANLHQSHPVTISLTVI